MLKLLAIFISLVLVVSAKVFLISRKYKKKEVFQNGKSYFRSSSASFNPTYLGNFSLTVFNNSEGISHLNTSGMILVDLEKIIAFMVVKDQIQNEYKKIQMRGKFDSSKISNGNYIMAYLRDQLHKYSNIKLAAPHAKGFYYCNSLPMMSESLLPINLFPRETAYWEVTFTIKAKVQKAAKLVTFLTFKIQGTAGA